MLTLNCLAVISPVRPSPDPILSPELAVGARLDIIDADGGLARAKRLGVAVRKVAEYSGGSFLCPRRDLGRSYLLRGLTMPVGGLSILFETLAESSWSRRQRVIGRSPILSEPFFSESIFSKN